MPKNLYSILGVLPQAEDVVIMAAYRALANRYHPDRWSGPPDVAHKRMSDINEAFATLRDPLRRAEYDRTREAQNGADYASVDQEDLSSAFRDALFGLEEKWKIAVAIFPDLVNIRTRLARISLSLAFSYVTSILESRAFSRREELASGMEQSFLARYFGTNRDVVEYAKRLILDGNRSAARRLNELIEVVGSEVDSSLLICKIDDEFGLRAGREAAALREAGEAKVQLLVTNVHLLDRLEDAVSLATIFGFHVKKVPGGIFSSDQLILESPSGEIKVFKNPSSFTYWVKTSLCPRVKGAV